MHPYLFIILPIVGAIAATVGTAAFLQRQRGSQHLSTLDGMIPLCVGFGVFYLLQFGLLAFVPGHGAGGPVQYLGGVKAAETLFSYRMILLVVGGVAALPLLALDLVVLGVSVIKRRKSQIFGAITANALLISGFLIAIGYPGWIPTA